MPLIKRMGPLGDEGFCGLQFSVGAADGLLGLDCSGCSWDPMAVVLAAGVTESWEEPVVVLSVSTADSAGGLGASCLGRPLTGSAAAGILEASPSKGIAPKNPPEAVGGASASTTLTSSGPRNGPGLVCAGDPQAEPHAVIAFSCTPVQCRDPNAGLGCCGVALRSAGLICRGVAVRVGMRGLCCGVL